MSSAGVPPHPVLRALRLSSRRGQRDLAAEVGVSQAQYSRIEAGGQKLTTEQWLAIAPRLALGTRGQEAPGMASLRFVLYTSRDAEDSWNLWTGQFIRDDLNRVGVFVGGRNACQTAGTLELFGMSNVYVICCTPAVIQDALFRAGGRMDERAVDVSRRVGAASRASAAVLGSMDFAVGAMQRLLAEKDEAAARAVTRARRR